MGRVLEQIGFAGDACFKQVSAMRSRFLDEEQLQCRYCPYGNCQSSCTDYVPAHRTQVPVRRGAYACV